MNRTPSIAAKAHCSKASCPLSEKEYPTTQYTGTASSSKMMAIVQANQNSIRE